LVQLFRGRREASLHKVESQRTPCRQVRCNAADRFQARSNRTAWEDTIYVKDLKRAIEDLEDYVEVRLMTQENYPFESTVAGTIIGKELNRENARRCETEEEKEEELKRFPNGALYLIEDEQVGYGSATAWLYCHRM
jgi:hypothetical protein